MGQLLSRKEKKELCPLEISRIPPHLWIKILNKTNTSSFPKLYRSCRTVKQLTDRGQGSIRISTPCVLEVSTRRCNGKVVVAYTTRPSWFGDGLTRIPELGEPISQHFFLLSCFSLTKLSFINLEEDCPEIRDLIVQQIKDCRIQAEKLSFGQYGYSSPLLRLLKATAIEITEPFLTADNRLLPTNFNQIKSLTLRLEQLSTRNLVKAFQDHLPKCKHVDILGNKQSQERLFTETFILLQKMASDKCNTQSIKLILFHHNFSSVERFLKQLCSHSKLIHHDNDNFFFSMSRKSLLGNVLVYLYWEKEVKIRMKVCKTERNDAIVHFLRAGIPIDQYNARFLSDTLRKLGETL